MPTTGKNLLLINPWIYDFAAFDLWSQPLGLLYLASFLRQAGFGIAYIDCLRSETPAEEKKAGKYGKSHYQRQIVQKPDLLSHVPRTFARYGISEQEFVNRLKNTPPPDAILVTSLMTYWYPGVKQTVQLVRKVYPSVPLILGGIYATLLPEHAARVIQPDFLITGPGERAVLKQLADMFNLGPPLPDYPDDLDSRPYPAFDLLSEIRYLCLMTARGCPYNCSFCAQKQISMKFTQRSPQAVITELDELYKRFKVRDIAFYDDALFINKERHIKIILSELINRNLPLRLHTPNGLFAGEIDAELARLMFKANFKTVRLSFETANEKRRPDMYNKISNPGMQNAVSNLIAAGYHAQELEAYIIMGLPGQTIDEVLESMVFINNLGLLLRLSSYSPIPGTLDFRRAVEADLISADIDPILTNKTILPLKTEGMNYETVSKIRMFGQVLNESALKRIKTLCGNANRRQF